MKCHILFSEKNKKNISKCRLLKILPRVLSVKEGIGTLGKILYFISYSTSVDFCRLLVTFANSLDPDQARQNVQPDLDPNCLMVFLKDFFFKKLIKIKICRQQKKHAKLPSRQRVKK